MEPIAIVTNINSFTPVWATNCTASTYTASGATITKPSGNGVIDLSAAGAQSGNQIVLVGFGTGNANTTFTARIEGFRNVGALWVPVPLGTLTYTLGAGVGVAGQTVTNAHKLADTVTGAMNTTAYELISPADDSVAMAAIDTKGCPIIKIGLATGGSDTDANVTDANVLYSWY